MGRGLWTEARQGDLSMDGAIPLLVVGFAQRFGPIGLERADGPGVGSFGWNGSKSASCSVRPFCRRGVHRRTLALPSWLVPVARSCRAGLGLVCWRWFSSAGDGSGLRAGQ